MKNVILELGQIVKCLDCLLSWAHSLEVSGSRWNLQARWKFSMGLQWSSQSVYDNHKYENQSDTSR